MRLALSLVHARAVQWMTTEDRDEFDGWMTCTVGQAMAFLTEQEREDMAERLRVAEMIGGG